MRILKDNKRLHQTLTCLLVDNNTGRQQVKNINFIGEIKFFKKKIRRMRILGTVFFLSFLAGKLNAFERMLLTEPIYKLSACVEKLPYFWRESFRQPFKYILYSKVQQNCDYFWLQVLDDGK